MIRKTNWQLSVLFLLIFLLISYEEVYGCKLIWGKHQARDTHYWVSAVKYDSIKYPIESISDKTAKLKNKKQEADSIRLVSPDVYCRGASPILTVTGENITWYANADKKTRLAQGSTYHASLLDTTTTFYLTQTIASTELPPVAITIEIVETFLRKMAITPASCGKNDGIISLTATGGTTRNPLQYRLNNDPFQPSPLFTNLAPGTYRVTLNVAGCYGSIDVSVSSPTPVIQSIDVVQPQCGNADGAVSISASGGSGLVSYSINGIDFSPNNQFNQLAAGDYKVTIRDQNGCAISTSITLIKTAKLEFGSVDVQPTTCGKTNGRIVLTAQAGNGLITYSIDGLTYQTQSLFDNMASGTYTVAIKDATGCMATKSAIIDASQGPTINQINIEPSACGTATGRLTISATGSQQLSYSLNGMPFQGDSSFNQLREDSYELAVKDEHNCQVRKTEKVSDTCNEAVYLPDSFTPNGDGMNEGWAIYFPFASLQLDELTIFNRWGDVIYEAAPRMITSHEWLWSGTYRNEQLTGIFTYHLKVEFPNKVSHVYKGKLVIVR